MKKRIQHFMAAACAMAAFAGGMSPTFADAVNEAEKNDRAVYSEKQVARSGSDLVDEAEGNNTPAEAQLIMANQETAQSVVDSTFDGRVVIKGYTDSADPDWYKVYLSAGTQYLSLNAGSVGERLEYEIKSEKQINTDESIKFGTIIKQKTGMTAVPFTLENAGYYYVGIKGTATAAMEYRMMVGNPTYLLAHENVKAPAPVTLTKKGPDQSVTFTANISSVPVQAYTTEVSFTGFSSTTADAITVKNNASGESFSVPTLTRRKSGLYPMRMPSHSIWTVTFTPSKYSSETFTPTLIVSYVYPVVD